jgi:hypothetical protein
VLVGARYWEGLVSWLRETMAGEGKIDASDLRLFHVTDDPYEVLRIMQEARDNGTRNNGEGVD